MSFTEWLNYVKGIKEMRHTEMPETSPKKPICHFQKLEMILKWNKQINVRLPQKYQFLLIEAFILYCKIIII